MRLPARFVCPIQKGIALTFADTAYQVRGRPFIAPTLHQLFELRNAPPQDSITLSISPTGYLVVQYADSAGHPVQATFQGKFKHRSYFEVFLNKEEQGFPPFFPILYGTTDILRIRLAQTVSGDLLLDYYSEHTANIFIMAGGGSTRYLCRYHLRH